MKKDSISLNQHCKENNKEYLLNEWDYEKNEGLKPDQVAFSSNKKVWWKCKDNHEWQTSPNSRTNMNSNCPFCSGRNVITGTNDLETKNPDVAKEWHPTLNGDLKPSQVVSGSSKKVWWKCSKEHEWQTTVNNRTKENGSNCPYCSNKQALERYNDLETSSPDISKEWDTTKNGDLKPSQVTSCSNKKVWWKCSSNHEWQTTVNNRTSSNSTNCPFCHKLKHLSIAQKIIYFYMKKVFKDTIIDYKSTWLGKMTLDIYIPSLKLAIEYDSKTFMNKDKVSNIEIQKNKSCEENNITLIRIRDIDCAKLDKNNNVLVLNQNQNDIEDLEKNIYSIFQYIKDKLKVSIDMPTIDIDEDIMTIIK